MRPPPPDPLVPRGTAVRGRSPRARLVGEGRGPRWRDRPNGGRAGGARRRLTTGQREGGAEAATCTARARGLSPALCRGRPSGTAHGISLGSTWNNTGTRAPGTGAPRGMCTEHRGLDRSCIGVGVHGPRFHVEQHRHARARDGRATEPGLCTVRWVLVRSSTGAGGHGGGTATPTASRMVPRGTTPADTGPWRRKEVSGPEPGSWTVRRVLDRTNVRAGGGESDGSCFETVGRWELLGVGSGVPRGTSSSGLDFSPAARPSRGGSAGGVRGFSGWGPGEWRDPRRVREAPCFTWNAAAFLVGVPARGRNCPRRRHVFHVEQPGQAWPGRRGSAPARVWRGMGRIRGARKQAVGGPFGCREGMGDVPARGEASRRSQRMG